MVHLDCASRREALYSTTETTSIHLILIYTIEYLIQLCKKTGNQSASPHILQHLFDIHSVRHGTDTPEMESFSDMIPGGSLSK